VFIQLYKQYVRPHLEFAVQAWSPWLQSDKGMLENLKPAAQCTKAAQTVLGQIVRAFQYRDRTIFLQLYKQYVRPHLEFAVQAWSPSLQADKELLENVQRRAVGMVSGLQSRDYEGRLRELKLTTLEEGNTKQTCCSCSRW
jgi:hypothetical protein